MTITLSQEVEKLLVLAEKTTNQNKDTIILEALLNYIEDMENYKSALQAETRLLKNPRCISVENLMKKANINASDI